MEVRVTITWRVGRSLKGRLHNRKQGYFASYSYKSTCVCVYEYDILYQCWIFFTPYKSTSLLYSDELIVVVGVSNQMFLQDIHYKIVIYSNVKHLTCVEGKIVKCGRLQVGGNTKRTSMVKEITIKNWSGCFLYVKNISFTLF